MHGHPNCSRVSGLQWASSRDLKAATQHGGLARWPSLCLVFFLPHIQLFLQFRRLGKRGTCKPSDSQRHSIRVSWSFCNGRKVRRPGGNEQSHWRREGAERQRIYFLTRGCNLNSFYHETSLLRGCTFLTTQMKPWALNCGICLPWLMVPLLGDLWFSQVHILIIQHIETILQNILLNDNYLMITTINASGFLSFFFLFFIKLELWSFIFVGHAFHLLCSKVSPN